MKKVLVNVKDQWSKRDVFEVAIVEDDGAIKWESNGRYLMDDTLDTIERNGFIDFSRVSTLRKREIQNAGSIEEYKRTHVRTEEQLAEMRAAFGEGAVICDVITGETFVL